MKIEIWSDMVCPFCYIGKRKLEEALKELPYRSEVQIQFRSFELDPDAPVNVDHDLNDALAAKFGISREQAKAMNDNVSEQARAVGLHYNLDRAVPTNTFDAHRLTQFAAQHGKMAEMTERLFQAYFSEGLHIGDHDTLVKLAGEVGLNESEARQVLESDQYTNEVRADEQEARQIGVQGVPFFVINRKYAVSGAQPVEVFVKALEQAHSEEKPNITFVGDNTESGAACTDTACTPENHKPERTS